MSKYLLDRQTVLDVTVNIIPLLMLVFFFILFALYDPYLKNTFMLGMSLFLLIIPFVFLLLLTYAAGRTIEREEEQTD
ncbi:DUF6684 family protein [Halocatena salina]|uniref:Cox cluster protein n=1 Tax=Halocatena salina TaxID=2934340 RepID=A0A8U0A2V9_9EURY|nr:DUF6684 family protein [Halocatena salina]UPM42317.1 cox cluster protein [Halocatena salina]